MIHQRVFAGDSMFTFSLISSCKFWLLRLQFNMPKSVVLLPSAKKRLISSLTCTNSNRSSEEKGFALKCSTEFASRSNCVFRKLQDIEKCHQTWVIQNETKVSFDEPDLSDKDQDETNVFKKPLEPVTKRYKTVIRPILRRNPKKWKKYSLADIPLSSDATNTSVALHFLDDLRKRRENDCESVNSDCENLSKITFLKPIKCSKNLKRKISVSSKTDEACAETSAYCSSQCFTQENAKKEENSSDFSIKLHHLQDECDEE